MYDIAIINIVQTNEAIRVYIEILNKKKIKGGVEKTFLLNDSYDNKLLKEFIEPYIADTPYYYIALLDRSSEQGAIPTCDKQQARLYKDLSDYQYLCIDSKWLCYSLKADIAAQQKSLDEIGVDFIFSPFVLLRNFFADKVQNEASLYVFLQEDSITIAIFKEGSLMFGDYIDLTLQQEEESLDFQSESIEEEVQESGFDLESIDEGNVIDLDDDLSLNSIEEMDSLDDLEDLDSLDDLDELSPEDQLENNLEEIENEEEELEEESESVEKSSRDFIFFSLIQDSLTHFYKEPRYNSEFIQNAFIADSTKTGKDFKRYLEEELFLSAYVRNIEPELEVCQLVKGELGLL